MDAAAQVKKQGESEQKGNKGEKKAAGAGAGAGAGALQHSIVDAAVALLLERIAALQQEMRAGRVTAEVRMGLVVLGNTQLIAEIHNLRPYTMSWNNVADYIHPRDFHTLARGCSAPADTLHYLYSMNWPHQICGASHIDAFVQLKDAEIWGAKLRLLLSGTREAINKLFLKMGLLPYLLSPPNTNAANLVDFALYDRYHEKWVDHFFDFSTASGPRANIAHVVPPMYDSLSRSISVVFLTFSYDEHSREC